MFKKVLIAAALNLIRKKLLVKINHVPLRTYIEKKLIPLEEVVDKLTDKNPNNAEQMKEVWEKHRHELETDTLGLAIDIVKEKVKDAAIKEVVIAALESYLEEHPQVA